MLALNFALAVIWMALQTSFSPADFLVGFLFGFVIIALTQRAMGRGEYGAKAWTLVKFVGFVFWSIIKANIEVAKVVLSPRMDVRPGIVAVPLDVQSNLGITVLANVITLTPGTLSVDVASDRRTLYIHTINVDDPDAMRQEIKEDFERRVMELMA